MKQEVLADAVGYSRTRLSEIENGELPPLDKAIALANALDVPLECLLAPFVRASPPRITPDFLAHFLGATPQEQRHIVALFEVLLGELKIVVASP